MAFEIDRLIWDLELPKAADHKTFEDQILNLTQQRIIPYLEQLAAQLPEYDGAVVLQRLEIDLGPLSPSDSVSDLAYRFEKKFYEALHLRLAALNPRVAIEEQHRPQWASKETYGAYRLLQFLEQGFLSSHTGGLRSGPDALQTLAQEAFQAPPAAFLRALSVLLRRVEVRQRVVHQFSPAIRQQLVAAISPAHAELFGKTTAELEKKLAPQVSAERLAQIRNRLWQKYLELLPAADHSTLPRLLGAAVTELLQAEFPEFKPQFQVLRQGPRLDWLAPSASTKGRKKAAGPTDTAGKAGTEAALETHRKPGQPTANPPVRRPSAQELAGRPSLTDVQQELLIQARLIAWLLQGSAEPLLARQPFFEQTAAQHFVQPNGVRLLSALQTIQAGGVPLGLIDRYVLPALQELPAETLKNVVALLELQMMGFIATTALAFQRRLEQDDDNPLKPAAALFPQVVYVQALRYFFLRSRQTPFRPGGFLDVLFAGIQAKSGLEAPVLARELLAVAREALFRNESRFIPLMDMLEPYTKQAAPKDSLAKQASPDTPRAGIPPLGGPAGATPGASPTATGQPVAAPEYLVGQAWLAFRQSAAGAPGTIPAAFRPLLEAWRVQGEGALLPENIPESFKRFVQQWLSFRRAFFLKDTPVAQWPRMPFLGQGYPGFGPSGLPVVPLSADSAPQPAGGSGLPAAPAISPGESGQAELPADTSATSPAGKRSRKKSASTTPAAPEEAEEKNAPDTTTEKAGLEVTYLRDYTRQVLNFMADSSGLRLPEGMQFTKEALLRSLDAPEEDNATAPAARAAERPAIPETTYPMYKETESIPVHNAGLVILNPFLPHFFRRLNMLGADGRFLGPEQAQRGVLLLEYMATKQTEMPEYMLSLNKLMCGLPLRQPIPGKIEMTEEEKELAESLLGAVVDQWKALGSSSPDGLRGAFLIREGVLRHLDQWKLSVEKKTFDMLLAKMPWSHSVVRLKWMPEPMFVEWGA